MTCTLTDSQLDLIAAGLTCRDRPDQRDRWISKGFARIGGHTKLVPYWRRRIDSNPADAAFACKAWEDYQTAVAGIKLPQSPNAPADTPPRGPGTELKKLLKKVGIEATPNCSCNARANLMDVNGPDWCETNRDTILGWLAEEAAKRKLPFSRGAASLMLTFAIKRGRKALAAVALQPSGSTPAAAEPNPLKKP